MADSSTGGALLPSGTLAPLEGQGLNRFLNGWIAGVSGLPGAFVRPGWQPFPADPPTVSGATVWAAYHIAWRHKLGFPRKVHDSTGDGQDLLQQQEQMGVLVSFYDQGTNGLADTYASVFRDGVFVDQNNELLFLNGFGLIDAGDLVPVPTLEKNRWYMRIDCMVTLQRIIQRNYPVLNLLGVDASTTSDVGASETITVSQ